MRKFILFKIIYVRRIFNLKDRSFVDIDGMDIGIKTAW